MNMYVCPVSSVRGNGLGGGRTPSFRMVQGSIPARFNFLSGIPESIIRNLLIGYGIEARNVGRPIIRSDSKVRSNHVRDDVLATQAWKYTD